MGRRHPPTSFEGRPSKESGDGFRIIRHGGRFTVYLWTLLWIGWNRRRIRAVIDSHHRIPFFTPLVVGRQTPVVLLLRHVRQELSSARTRR